MKYSTDGVIDLLTRTAAMAATTKMIRNTGIVIVITVLLVMTPGSLRCLYGRCPPPALITRPDMRTRDRRIARLERGKFDKGFTRFDTTNKRSSDFTDETSRLLMRHHAR